MDMLPSSGASFVRDRICFVWPATGAMHVTPLPRGGCTVKFSFGERAIVRSIGPGRIVKAHDIPTRRIAHQHEISIQHDGDFESRYSIVDQTPHDLASAQLTRRLAGISVEAGQTLYEIMNGGSLHFQLLRAGVLVDPRIYMQPDFDDESGQLGRLVER